MISFYFVKVAYVEKVGANCQSYWQLPTVWHRCILKIPGTGTVFFLADPMMAGNRFLVGLRGNAKCGW
jgi:hypothetical protein